MAAVRLSLSLTLLLTACSSAQVVPFTQSGAPQYPPKPVREVGVYRSQLPFEPFEQMGLITVTLPSGDLNRIYEELRAGAAAMGADAVVGVKVDVRYHAEATTREVCHSQKTCVPQTSCVSDSGECKTEEACTSTPVCVNVAEPPNTTSYLGIATMIRRTQ